jgi:hypothetical protein
MLEYEPGGRVYLAEEAGREPRLLQANLDSADASEQTHCGRTFWFLLSLDRHASIMPEQADAGALHGQDRHFGKAPE